MTPQRLKCCRWVRRKSVLVRHCSLLEVPIKFWNVLNGKRARMPDGSKYKLLASARSHCDTAWILREFWLISLPNRFTLGWDRRDWRRESATVIFFDPARCTLERCLHPCGKGDGRVSRPRGQRRLKLPAKIGRTKDQRYQQGTYHSLENNFPQDPSKILESPHHQHGFNHKLLDEFILTTRCFSAIL